MNKESYIEALKEILLRETNRVNAAKIIEYYEQYFDDGHDLGKTDEEMRLELGEPEVLAKEVLAGMQLKTCDLFESEDHVRMIDMTLIDIRVHLVFSNRNVFSVTYQGFEDYDPQMLKVDYISNHLRIVQKADRVMQWRQNEKPYLLVELPQNYKGKLLVETRDSRIIVDGKDIETKGRLHLNSKHGRIECNELACRDILVTTEDGRVKINACHIKTVYVESAKGLIEMERSRIRYFQAKSQEGRIEVDDSRIELAELETGTERIVVDESWVDDCRMESDEGRIYYALSDPSKGLHLDLLSRHGKAFVNGKQISKGVLVIKDLKPKKKEKRYLNVYARTASGRIEIMH